LGGLFDFVDSHIAQSSQSQQPNDVQQLPCHTAYCRKARALLKQMLDKSFPFLKQRSLLMTGDIKRLFQSQ